MGTDSNSSNANPSNANRIAELLAAYREADYRWELDGEWHPLAIGRPTVRLEQAFPQASRFGLLSAWNPQSVMLPDGINRTADEMLHAALLQSGLPFRPGFSSARNRSWREPSWVVMDMDEAEFDRLAQRFGQLGALRWQRGEPVRLRMYAQRPVLARARECLDWVEPSAAPMPEPRPRTTR